MNYETQRNKVIRRHINGIIHLNHIIHDGQSNYRHRERVNQICNLLMEKEYDFLTRPEVIVWNGRHFSQPESLYPDVITWIPEPFKTVIIEVTDSEKKDHAESKNYPSGFKVISHSVEDSLEDLSCLI